MKDYLLPIIIILSIIAVAIIAMVILAFVKRRKKPMSEKPMTALSVPTTTALDVKFEKLPSLTKVEESKLSVISDNKLAKRIVDTIPNAAEAVETTKNAAKAANVSKDLYRVIIPNGATLDKSRSMKDAVRATYRTGKKIKGQANLVHADEAVKDLSKATAVNSAYNIASMVVGQHYMAEIDERLDAISEDVEKILKFQESDYKSRVQALIAEIQNITDFQVEILNNENSRMIKLNHLQSLRIKCTELLGHANDIVEAIYEKQPSKYSDYEKILQNADAWHFYQNLLLELLYKISEIEYILNLGQVSKEQCVSVCAFYFDRVQNIQLNLREWHERCEEKFAIDTENSKRKRIGFEGVVFKIPSLINNELAFKPISEVTAEMIDDQSSLASIPSDDNNPFNQDVQLIVKDGEIYYLPE